MTTKKWLINLLERELAEVRNYYDCQLTHSPGENKDFLEDVDRLEKARRLVENGPEEP